MKVGDTVRWDACDWSEEYKQKYCALGLVLDHIFGHLLIRWYSHGRTDCKWHGPDDLELISAGNHSSKKSEKSS